MRRSPVLASGGYTLLELIVVIALVGILLFFTVPKFEGRILSDNNRAAFRWITHTVRDLRQRAQAGRTALVLHVDVDRGAFWHTDAGMKEEAVQEAMNQAYTLPEELRVADVAFPDGRKVATGRADIHFSDQGYADKAAIHLIEEDDRYITFLIEPFLPRLRQYQEYVDIDG